MTHLAEIELERNMKALRAAELPMEVANQGASLAEQVFLFWDAEAADVRVRVLPEPGALATIEAEVTGAPRWFSLTVGLGELSFVAGEVVGLVVAGRAEAPFTTAPFLRAGAGLDERNSRLGEEIEIGQGPGVALRHLTVTRREADGSARYTVLILPLPQESFRFTLTDMRLFVLPADATLQAESPRLGSQAV